MTKVLFTSSTKTYGNMSFRRGNPEEARQNRLNFFSENNLDYKNHVSMSPTHTTNIKIVTSLDKNNILEETDGIITNDPSIILFTLTGDCIPLAIYDPIQKIFGLFHLSWKNSSLNFPEIIIKKFLNLKSSISNLKALFGPSIGPCCYSQKNPSQLKDKQWKSFINKLPPTHHHLPPTYSINLWGFVENELQLLGVKKSNINNPRICTYHSNKYFSHHKAIKEKQTNDYRFGTLISIK